MLTRRHFVATGAACCALARTTFGAEPIRLMTLNGVDYMVAPYARDHGMFAAASLDVDVQISPTPNLLPAVFSGALDLGIATIPQVAQANEAGYDLVIACGAGVISQTHLTTAIVVRQDVKLATPADFAGKSVMSPGTMGTFPLLFIRYLEKNGVDPKSIRFVEGNFAQMGDVLRSGNVDAVLTTEPFLTRIVDGGVGRRVDYFLPDRPYVVAAVYIARRGWAESHREQLLRLRDAMIKANDDMRNHPPESAAAITSYLKLPAEVVTKLGPPETKPDLTPDDVQFWIDVALQQKLISKRVDPGSLLL